MKPETVNANGSAITPMLVRFLLKKIETPDTALINLRTAAEWEKYGESVQIVPQYSTIGGIEIAITSAVPEGEIVFAKDGAVMGRIVNIGKTGAGK